MSSSVFRTGSRADGAAGAHDGERGNDPLRRIRALDRKNTSRARAARPQRGANRDDAGVELAIADSAPEMLSISAI